MIIEKRVQLQYSISSIKAIEGKRATILDSSNSCRIFSLEPIRLVDGFKTSLPQSKNVYSGAEISDDGVYAAFSVKKRGVALFNVLKKSLIFTFKRHEGEVEALAFSQKGEYLATGGQDGKTFLWSLSTGKMVASFPHHSDFVTAISFKKRGNWIATGSYDRKIIVTNISSLSQSFKLVGHSKAITSLLFIKGNRLVAGDKAGEIVVWDYHKSKVIKRLEKMLDEVTSISITKDDRFLFSADKSGVVSLYDLESYERISLRYLHYLKPVRKLCYVAESNHLIVGLEGGEVTFNAPLKESNQMQDYIAKGNLAEAYKLAEENPLLRYSKPYLDLEMLWEKAFKQAVSLLEIGKKEEAKKLLAPFGVEASKRLAIQQLINDFTDFKKFKTAVEQKKYQLAYSIAAKHPMLKQNRYYETMEREWKTLFAKAKKIILQNGGEDRAKELLKPFRGVSNKSSKIQSLFSQKEIYRLFTKMISKKDFKSAMELAKRYPLVMEFEEFKKIEKIADLIEERALRELEAGKYADAARLASQLLEFSNKKDIANDLISRANLYASIMNYFAAKKYDLIYKVLTRYPELEDTKVIQEIENDWLKRVKSAEVAAAKGDVASIKKVMAPFIDILQKRAKIVTLIKHAYLAQMENLFKNKERLFGAVKRYLEIFGMDDEIESWLNEHAVAEKFEDRPSVDTAQIDPAILPEDILEAS